MSINTDPRLDLGQPALSHRKLGFQNKPVGIGEQTGGNRFEMEFENGLEADSQVNE